MRAAALTLLLASFAAIGLGGCPGGGVGDPCTPEDEYVESFAGFKLTQDNIESRSFQCQTRICLVNHFQGRVSCPQGQDTPTPCTGDGECDAGAGETCTNAGAIVRACDPTPCGESADDFNCNDANGRNKACVDRVCSANGRYCQCNDDADCPPNYVCDPTFKQCVTKVCSKPGDVNTRCYVPGTDIPITMPVCAQCAPASKRDAENAVYCSCRCLREGDEEDPNFNYCECPEGYGCTEIRKDLALGDKQLVGSYCIKEDTAYVDETRCGQVQGYWGTQCNGTAP